MILGDLWKDYLRLKILPDHCMSVHSLFTNGLKKATFPTLSSGHLFVLESPRSCAGSQSDGGGGDSAGSCL